MCLVWGRRSWRQCLGEGGSGGQESLLLTSCWQDCPLRVLRDSRHSPRTCPRLSVAKFWITRASQWIMQCTEFKRKGLSESTLIQLYNETGRMAAWEGSPPYSPWRNNQADNGPSEAAVTWKHVELWNQPQVTNGRGDVYQGQPASKLNPSPIRTPSTFFFLNLI